MEETKPEVKHYSFLSLKNIVLIVAFFLLIGIFTFLLFAPTRRDGNNPSAIPTPYPLDSSDSSKPLTVTSVFPDTNATNTSIKTQILVTFSRPPTTGEKAKIAIQLQPTVPGSLQWELDNYRLRFIPTLDLSKNTLYTISLTYPTRKWQFKTTQLSDQDFEKTSQSQADQNFAKLQNDAHKNYPWIDQLPIQTDSYFGYFDIEKNTFIVTLYPKSESDTEIEDLKKQVFARLTSLGVSITNFSFTWNMGR